VKTPKNFGRYEVLDLISQGGMGTLFRARDPRIGRYVAVKVLKRSFDTEELRDRFSREARAAGCLSHPNIVTIYDVGEQDGLPFIAMEYVRGETFIELVGLRPPLPVERKLQLMEEVCAGLNHAHEAGIVHRDIKPANLILSSEGTVKILDFGIAKLNSANMTIPGAIMGTLNYMSPEQAKGTRVDTRTDIFAVGVVMYELLSHQPAFTGTYPTEALHKILHGSPTPITEHCPGIDPRLVELIDRTLEKDPDKRFQTIAAVGKAISNIRLDSARVTRSSPRTTPRPAQRTNDPATRRAEHIEDLLAAAERAFDSADYDGAIDACKQVLLLDASNARALSELDRVQAAIDERQAEVRAAVDRGRAALASGNLMAALREVKQALVLDPNDGDALALSAQTEQTSKDRQEEARVRTAVGAARRQFAAGEHRAALAALETLPASHPLVRPAIDELRTALNQIEEQQRIETELQEHRRHIAALAAQAGAAIAASRPDEASRIVAQIRRQDPSAPEIADLTERMKQAEATARARAEVERALAEFEARLGEGDLTRADASLAAVAALAANDSRLPSARQRLSAAQAAAAARAAAEARKRECDHTLDVAAARIQAGDPAGAGDMVKRAGELVPDHPRIKQVAEELRLALERKAAAEAAEQLRLKVEALVRSAAAHLESGADNAAELSAAIADANRALELDPTSVDAAAVKRSIDAAVAARRETARVRAAIDNAGRRFAHGKHQSAIKLLEEFDPPDHPDIVKALGELRSALHLIEEEHRKEQERIERRQRAAAFVGDARASLQEGHFDEALQMLSIAEEIDPATADVAPLRDEIVRAQAAARLRAEIDGIVAQVDDRLSGGDFDAARELLNRAASVSATDDAVVGARQRLNQAIAQAEAAAREAAAAREREAAAARAREEAAAREREAAAARAREAAAAREREAAAARAREEAAAREREAAAARAREEAAAREREAAAARARDEAAAREAAAAREREAAAAREAAARDAIAAREAAAREAAAQREREAAEAAAREAAAAREREVAAARDEARARLAAREREVATDPNAETLFAGDLQRSIRAALEESQREARTGSATTPPGPSAPAPPHAAADAARQKADELLAAARATLEAPDPQMADVTSALQQIEQALAAVPNDSAALTLETTANEALARLRASAQIEASVRNARSRFAIGKHHAAIQLLEGLDQSHAAVAAALKDLRVQLQTIEDRRRQAEEARSKPRELPDEEATRVIVLPELLAQVQAEAAARAQPAAGATMISNRSELPGDPAASDPAPGLDAPPPDSAADSQKRLILFGGVLVLLLLLALVLLRFAS
jgi:serine/threonine protein kinase